MSKPGAWALSGEAKNFVFSNFGVLKHHLKIVFPMILLVEILNQVGYIADIKFMPLVTLFPALVLYACFALSWHRSSLRGADDAHMVNPLRLDREDFKFINIFLALAIVPTLVIFLIGFLYGLSAGVGGRAVAYAGILFVLIAGFFLVRAMLQFSFKLPARSVGVALTFRQARQVSKDMLWPLIGAGMIFGLLFLIVLVAYSGVIGAIVYFVSGDVEPEGMKLGFVQFVLSVPVYMAAFVLMALNITALSRAYQWGMQNTQVD